MKGEGAAMTVSTARDAFAYRWTWAGVVVVVLSTAVTAAAQLAPLVNAAGEVREEAYDHLRRTLSGADQTYGRIDGRELKGWMNDVVAISR